MIRFAGVGSFRVPIEIARMDGGRFDRLDALVDTGATYTTWPRDRLKALGVQPEEQWPFVLADGREVNFDLAWAQIRINGKTQPTIVIFGEPGAEPLLGVFALEGFRLAADPVNHQLVSVPGLLKQLAAA